MNKSRAKMKFRNIKPRVLYFYQIKILDFAIAKYFLEKRRNISLKPGDLSNKNMITLDHLIIISVRDALFLIERSSGTMKYTSNKFFLPIN